MATTLVVFDIAALIDVDLDTCCTQSSMAGAQADPSKTGRRFGGVIQSAEADLRLMRLSWRQKGRVDAKGFPTLYSLSYASEEPTNFGCHALTALKSQHR
jgi:hypothetical protein